MANRVRVLIAVSVLAASLGLSVPLARADGTTFIATADAHIRQDRPTTNFGAANPLTTDITFNKHRYGYYKFDVSGIPSGSTNIQATLAVKAQTTEGTRQHEIWRAASTAWTENGITWNNAPGTTGARLDVRTGTTSGQFQTWNVSSSVTGNGTYAFVLVSGVPAGITNWSSDEAASGSKPELRLSWTAPVDYNRLVGFFLNSGENLDLCNGAVPANKFSHIVIQWYMAVDATCGISQIKAIHTAAKVMAYQNLGAMIGGPHTANRPSTGVTKEDADAHEASSPHTDSWFLHKASDGSHVTFCDFTYLYAANIGRSSYQAAWKQHVADIKTDGFDGIMADDTNTFPGHCMNQGEAGQSSEYPTNNSYRDATVAAVNVLGNDVQAQGLLFVPNVGMNPWEPDHYAGFQSMLPNISGAVREFWMAWNGSSGPFTGDMWTQTLKIQTDAEAAGKFLAANTYPYAPRDDVRAIRYGLASFYAAWNGTVASSFGYDDGRVSYSQYRQNLNAPTEPKQAVGVGWIRHYGNGVVVVNPDPTTAQTFSLGGAYRDPNGNLVSSVTLQPGTGMVLLS